MYEAFYQLREKPFSILPDPDLIYWGKMHSMAFTMLEFGLMNNAGFTVITGEIGSGKTTLVRHLLKKISPGITVGLISNSPQGRQELPELLEHLPFFQPIVNRLEAGVARLPIDDLDLRVLETGGSLRNRPCNVRGQTSRGQGDRRRADNPLHHQGPIEVGVSECLPMLQRLCVPITAMSEVRDSP